MTTLNKKVLAIIGALALGSTAYTQDIDNQYGDFGLQVIPESSLDGLVSEDFNFFRHTIQENEDFESLKSNFMTPIDSEEYGNKLDYIADTRRNPLSAGDMVTILERRTDEGVFYPYYINIGYADPEKHDLELIAHLVPKEQDRWFRFTLLYHDLEGRRYMTFWNNTSKNPAMFDVEGPYPNNVDFALEGKLSDFNVTSPFGWGPDPFADPGQAAGGSDDSQHGMRNHEAVDIVMQPGDYDFIDDITKVELHAPADGFVKFGYAQLEDTMPDTIMDEVSVGRYLFFRAEEPVEIMDENGRLRQRNIIDRIVHCRGFPEELLDQALPSYAADWWWKRILNDETDEEWIVNDIRGHYQAGRLKGPGIQTEWVPVEKGDVIGYISLAGSKTQYGTGLRTGDHAHIERYVNWRRVDVLAFMEKNGIKDFYPSEMQEELSTIEEIISYVNK